MAECNIFLFYCIGNYFYTFTFVSSVVIDEKMAML